MSLEELTRKEEEEARFLAKEERIRELRKELIGQDLEVDDVARILDLERSTVLRYLREQVIIGYQIGRTYRVSEDELRTYKERLLAQEREQQRRKRISADIEQKFALWARAQPEKQWAKTECPECGSVMLSSATQSYDADLDTYYDVRQGSCEVCGQKSSWHPSKEEIAQIANEAQWAKVEADVRYQLERLRQAGKVADEGHCDRCGCLALLRPPTLDDLDGLETIGITLPPNNCLVGSCGNCGYYVWMERPEPLHLVSDMPF